MPVQLPFKSLWLQFGFVQSSVILNIWLSRRYVPLVILYLFIRMSRFGPFATLYGVKRARRGVRWALSQIPLVPVSAQSINASGCGSCLRFALFTGFGSPPIVSGVGGRLPGPVTGGKIKLVSVDGMQLLGNGGAASDDLEVKLPKILVYQSD